MDIEGLVSRAGKGGAVVLSPRNGGRRQIAVRRQGGGAVLEVQEDGACLGIAPGESVSVAVWEDAVIDRVARALATLHLGIEEASAFGTSADAALISRGFIVGRSSVGLPVWIAPGSGTVTVISKDEKGGLPELMNEPAVLVFSATGDGARVVIRGENLSTIVSVHESGRVAAFYNPSGDVVVEGALDKDTVTFH